MTKKKLTQYLEAEISKRSQGLLELIFTKDADFDHNMFDNTVNIEDKVREITNTYPVNQDDCIIIINEIESWFLSGLDSETCKHLNLNYFPVNEEITKEKYEREVEKLDINELVLRYKIFEAYNIEVARKQNSSFDFFCRVIFE